jgi:hypothetical protein
MSMLWWKLELIVNFDAPNHYEDYVHRVWRTGRAGRKGVVITFISEEEERYAPDLVKALELSEQPIPEDLKKLVEGFKAKVSQGTEHAHGTGYGGSGFKFNEEEDKARKAAKKSQAREYRCLGQPLNLEGHVSLAGFHVGRILVSVCEWIMNEVIPLEKMLTPLDEKHTPRSEYSSPRPFPRGILTRQPRNVKEQTSTSRDLNHIHSRSNNPRATFLFPTQTKYSTSASNIPGMLPTWKLSNPHMHIDKSGRSTRGMGNQVVETQPLPNSRSNSVREDLNSVHRTFSGKLKQRHDLYLNDQTLLNLATIPGQERAMFLTFSRGFPLNELDLIDYFNRQFEGEVVQRVVP